MLSVDSYNCYIYPYSREFNASAKFKSKFYVVFLKKAKNQFSIVREVGPSKVHRTSFSKGNEWIYYLRLDIYVELHTIECN